MSLRSKMKGLLEGAHWTRQSLLEISAPLRGRMVEYFTRRPRMIFFPILGVGILFFLGMVSGKGEPVKSTAGERSVAARVLTVTEVAVVPRAVGYGYVQPGRDWEAMAEVAGTIVEMHPDFREGGTIAKGEVLLRIDPVRSELAMVQSEASVTNVTAQIKELDQREADIRRTLANERKALELSRSELERYKKLIETGTIARSELDAVEQSYLAQANAVETYRGQLNQIPAEREALQAQLAANESATADARLTVDKTTFVAPFDCRVAEMNVELGQAVQVGKVMAVLDTLDLSEAVAQVPLYAFRSLLQRGSGADGTDGGLETMQSFSGLEAIVRIDLAGRTAEWHGTVSRVSDEVDSATRTLGVYVAVEEPYGQSVDQDRPPLVKNMYAEVELRGDPMSPVVVVPRSAIHQGLVYVVGDGNRLEFRPVEVEMNQGDMAVIASGLAAGERIVATDLIPAVEGMLLDPVEDAPQLQALLAYARGEGAVK